MAIRFGQNPAGGIYFGPQDAVAGGDLQASGTASGVATVTAAGQIAKPGSGTVDGTSLVTGAAQSALKASGVANGTSASSAYAAGASRGFGTAAGTSTATASGAKLILASGTVTGTSIFERARFIQIGTRDPGLPANAGLFDDDTLGAGITWVYGKESPADWQWDFSGLANWYINDVPDGGTFTYRLWDVDLNAYSNQAIESFSIQATIQPGSGTAAGNSSASGAAELHLRLLASGQADGLSLATASGRPAGELKASGTAAGSAALVAVSRGILRAQGVSEGQSALSGDGDLRRLFGASGSVSGSSALFGDAKVGKFGSGTADGFATARAAPYMLYRPSALAQGQSTIRAGGQIPGASIGPVDNPGIVSISSEYGTLSKSPTYGAKGSTDH